MMKNLILLVVLCAGVSSYAGKKEVLNHVLSSSRVQAEISELKNAHKEQSFEILSASAFEMGKLVNAGNPLGGNGVTTQYLVKIPYRITQGLNSVVAGLYVLVEEDFYHGSGADPFEHSVIIVKIIDTAELFTIEK